METSVHTAIRRFVHQHPLKTGANLVIGVSGGADSVCLLIALSELAQEFGVSIHAAYVHHGMRLEADSEIRNLQSLCDHGGVPLHIGRADVPSIAAAERVSLEVAGRLARYRFLFETSCRLNAALCTGHTHDDQAETVLLRVLSGTGMEGLGGIAPERVAVPPESPSPVRLLRPIIHVTRTQTLDFCRERGIEVVVDPYNADLRYPRNRMRHVLIPEIEKTCNPAVRDALVRLADLARADNQVLDDQARLCLDPGALVSGPPVQWSLEPWLALPLALQRRTARLYLSAAGARGKATGFANVDRLIGAAQAGQQRIHLDGALEFSVGQGKARLDAISGPSEQAIPERPLPIPGEAQISAGVLRAQVVEPGEQRCDDPFTAFLDADLLEQTVIRSRQPGDVIQPLGMKGHRKVSDVLSDRKVPKALRNTVPLVVSQDHIAWIAGIMVSEVFKVTNRTRRVVRLSLEPDRLPGE